MAFASAIPSPTSASSRAAAAAEDERDHLRQDIVATRRREYDAALAKTNALRAKAEVYVAQAEEMRSFACMAGISTYELPNGCATVFHECIRDLPSSHQFIHCLFLASL